MNTIRNVSIVSRHGLKQPPRNLVEAGPRKQLNNHRLVKAADSTCSGQEVN